MVNGPWMQASRVLLRNSLAETARSYTKSLDLCCKRTPHTSTLTPHTPNPHPLAPHPSPTTQNRRRACTPYPAHTTHEPLTPGRFLMQGKFCKDHALAMRCKIVRDPHTSTLTPHTPTPHPITQHPSLQARTDQISYLIPNT